MSRFVFLADPQLGCRATFSGLSEDAVQALRNRDMYVDCFPAEDDHLWEIGQVEKAVEAIEAAKPDFVVVGGDMIDDIRRADQYRDLMAGFASVGVPIHWVPGNHDIAFDGEQPTHRSIEHYESLFGDSTYAIDGGEVSLVALNTTVMHRPERVGDVLASQLRFVERAVADAHTPVILVGHHPLFLRMPDEPDSYWTIPCDVRERLLALRDDHDIVAMFAGHYHRNQVARTGTFEMVTSGPVGFPLGVDPPGIRIVEHDGRRLRHEYVPI
ncbi:MAG: hypothetical protein HKN46_00080 [Acidimicrobiia bacterium]|nr:hypothetical protein [Acidimicrobiia bacterium]